MSFTRRVASLLDDILDASNPIEVFEGLSEENQLRVGRVLLPTIDRKTGHRRNEFLRDLISRISKGELITVLVRNKKVHLRLPKAEVEKPVKEEPKVQKEIVPEVTPEVVVEEAVEEKQSEIESTTVEIAEEVTTEEQEPEVVPEETVKPVAPVITKKKKSKK